MSHKQSNFESARDWEAGIRDEDHKRRLARWGVAWVLFSLVVMPLFLAVILPALVRFFR